MGLIELVLTGADNGWFGDQDWRAIIIVIGGFWPQLLDGSTLPLFDGQRVTMFLSHAFLHGNLLHFLMNGVILLSLGKLVADMVRTGPDIAIGQPIHADVGNQLGVANAIALT